MKTYDAVVAGGGLIGASIALELTSAGLQVGVFDAQKPGREASWASAGMISPSPESAELACVLPLSMASVRAYPEFIHRVEDLSGKNVGYRKEGALDIFLAEVSQEEIAEILEEHRRTGLTAELVSSEQACELEPAITAEIRAGIVRHDEASLDNRIFTEATLEAVITGTYDLQLTTSDERLSTSLTAGGTRNLELVVKNTGTSDLSNVSLTATTPTDWEVTFEPAKIANLAPGASTQVTATIKADKNAIAGDYIVSMTSKTAEKSADATLRMTVKTSVLWGWIGILIIIAVIGGVYYLFRTYGRR
ncbi:MAG: FAD-dependent oxidoreductase [Burkholderiales bacterium]|nr:FAD-dependent oxidoreductase [Burkholderiales bacterium]